MAVVCRYIDILTVGAPASPSTHTATTPGGVSYSRGRNVESMGGSPGEFSEEIVAYEKWKKGWRMNCDVGEATEGLENELWRR